MSNQNYKLSSTDSLFYGNYSVVEGEINYSNTVTFINEVDLSSIEAIRRSYPKGMRPTYTVFIAKAIAMALNEHKYANRRFFRPFGFLKHKFQIFNTVDIAIASETRIPGAEYIAFFDVIRGVENLSIGSISKWLTEFRENTEENTQWKLYKKMMTQVPGWLGKFLIRLPVYIPSLWQKYRGGAVMISSPAKYGVDGVVACWPTPIGISFGMVKDRVIVKNGEMKVCPTCMITFNFDRRLMAGAPAARVLNRFVELLETWPVPAIAEKLESELQSF